MATPMVASMIFGFDLPLFWANFKKARQSQFTPGCSMFIQEIILEGFKSYATRTVIGGWDSEFNAITGLNGTGKSNILDAICFVLGIENLRQVSLLWVNRSGIMAGRSVLHHCKT